MKKVYLTIPLYLTEAFILCIDNKVDFIMDRQADKVLLYLSWTSLCVMENNLYVMENNDLYEFFKASLYDTRI